MPSSLYFGLNDMSTLIVNFCSYFAIMGMYDAMYRMFFENEEKEYKRSVCSTTLFFTLFTSTILFLFMLIFKWYIASFFFKSQDYVYLVYISAIATLVSSTNSIVSAPTRMQNKRMIFIITNTISPIVSYSISIPLLLNGHYVIALPLATAISGIIMEIAFWIMNKEWFTFKNIDFTLLKALLSIGVPLLPNFLIYWIFNSSDRLMIARLIGIDASGIYAIGAKLGFASQLIYTAFAGGWQYFAFSTMKEKNQVKSNSQVFEYLGTISFISTLFICVVAKPIYMFVFEQEYHSAFIVSPYLFMAPLLQMLFQIAANQFLVVKKTWPNFIILSSGAIVNIILNFYLIPIMGIEGAAIATLSGYIISDCICVAVLIKKNLMIFSCRFCIITLIMAAMFLLWRTLLLDNIMMSFLLFLFFTILSALFYKKEILHLTKSLNKRFVKDNFT